MTGFNGDTQAHIGSSKSIDVSFYDEDQNEISVAHQQKPVEIWISKDTSVAIEPYILINATQNQTDIQGFMSNGFNLTGSNVSIHIQIRPNRAEASIGYLTLLKFGENPSLVNKYYDSLNLYCPNDLQPDYNESFYMIFANMSQVNGFKGYVGFSVREINQTLFGINCYNKTLNSIDSIIDKLSGANASFSYWLRIYTSGCYYMDPLTFEWSTYGMEILADTNLTHTHCVSNHLTTFAGGFLVLPNAINFNKVWANASFLQNPVIYSAVICLVSLYILLSIWARYMDLRDGQKVGVTFLGDLNQKSKYIYEIIVFTGNRINAGTKSKVNYF